MSESSGKKIYKFYRPNSLPRDVYTVSFDDQATVRDVLIYLRDFQFEEKIDLLNPNNYDPITDMSLNLKSFNTDYFYIQDNETPEYQKEIFKKKYRDISFYIEKDPEFFFILLDYFINSPEMKNQIKYTLKNFTNCIANEIFEEMPYPGFQEKIQRYRNNILKKYPN